MFLESLLLFLVISITSSQFAFITLLHLAKRMIALRETTCSSTTDETCVDVSMLAESQGSREIIESRTAHTQGP